MTLEELQPNSSVRGILPDALVTVVSVKWFGTEALELTYKTAAGKVANELLYRHDEPRLEIVEQGRPWSFDGDGGLFRLVSEAQRIRLAHLSGEPDFDIEGFESEAEVLVEHKLLLRRTDSLKNQKETREVTKWMFRHDKIIDFLMAPAFRAEHADRQTKHVDNPSFSGVYEVLAFQLPLEQAKELQDFLVDWAAETNQNDLLNRFTRRLNARKVAR